jgi:hypothetical protein
MERGFIFDFMGEQGTTVAQWSSGVPTKSFWTGVKVHSDQLLPVVAYRCLSCGLLELYARPDLKTK